MRQFSVNTELVLRAQIAQMSEAHQGVAADKAAAVEVLTALEWFLPVVVPYHYEVPSPTPIPIPATFGRFGCCSFSAVNSANVRAVVPLVVALVLAQIVLYVSLEPCRAAALFFLV